jgi:ubiquitin carboxyl-terminal hydrolase 4/11/15
MMASEAPQLQPLRVYPFMANRVVDLFVNTEAINANTVKIITEMEEELKRTELFEHTRPKLALEKCFEWYSISEVLDDNNKWLCPNCRQLVCADKKMDVWSVAPVLVLHLKRFTGGRSCSAKKFDGLVEFPEVLDMSGHVVGPQRGASLTYRLYGVSHHSGGLGGGHYTAHAVVSQPQSEKRTWYYFNDATVRTAAVGDWERETAYVLFYEKVDPAELNAGSGDGLESAETDE